MEKADLRALLNRDIDDVVRWAYDLTGGETGLDLSLEELANIFTNVSESQIVRLRAIEAIKAMPPEVFLRTELFNASRCVLRGLADVITHELNKEIREWAVESFAHVHLSLMGAI